MKRMFVLAAVLATGLAACAPSDVVYGPGDMGRRADVASPESITKAVDEADWSKAVDLSLRIRQGDFNPMVLSLRVGAPYRLTLVNDDDVVHSFAAAEFFAEAAVKSLEPTETPIKPGSALEVVLLEPGASRTVELIPLREGTYDFEDGEPGIYMPGLRLSVLNRIIVAGKGYLIVKPAR